MGDVETRLAVMEDRVKRIESDFNILRDDLKEQLREIKDMMTKWNENTNVSIKNIGDQLNKKAIWALVTLNGALFSLVIYLFMGHYKA
jgi:predicted nuclease with TOPRIM domain